MARAQQASAPTDPLAAMRAQMAATPIESTQLAAGLTMLSGPGGNVIAYTGQEGKLLIDTFVKGVFAGLKQRLDAMGTEPLLFAIDTHWHFDQVDNNESVHNAGATLIAHENTRKRLSESHDLLGMHFNPAPAAALPTETFKQNHRIPLNTEYIELGYFQPAHTDTDIYVQFVLSEVFHLGDTFFNGMYPFIDIGTGGNIKGMSAAADREALMKYRDMLVTVHDRVEKLKTSGRTEEEAVAAKPTADLDAAWGKGFIQADAFVGMVYNTL